MYIYIYIYIYLYKRIFLSRLAMSGKELLCARVCCVCVRVSVCVCVHVHEVAMGWLRLIGSLKLKVSFAKEPYKIDYILHKRPIILRSLLIVATP